MSTLYTPVSLPQVCTDWSLLKSSDLFITSELGRHVKDSMGTVVAFLFSFAYPFIKTPESGAQTTIFCAVDESVADQTGLYYSDCCITKEAPQALSDDDAKKLWEISEKLTGVKL